MTPALTLALTLARKCRLTRPERIELATYVLDREVTSWRHLAPHEVSRLCDVLAGAQYIASIQADKRNGLRPTG